MFWVVGLALTAASAVYQRKQQKKLQAKIDAQRGFSIAVDGSPIHLPLVYGYQSVGGVRVYHKTADSMFAAGIEGTSFKEFRSRGDNFNKTSGRYSGSDNEYLLVQQALCHGGIDGIIDFTVDNLDYQRDDTNNFNHLIRAHLDGGEADPQAILNGVPETSVFTDVAYLSEYFKLKRDDYNYNGVPSVSAFVRGLKVHTIEFDGSSYVLSSEKVFSNNPAYVLLDYLTRPIISAGAGINPNEIDLYSFYHAAQICDTVVEEDVIVKGRINGVRPVDEDAGEEPAIKYRDIKLYEANITVDPSLKVRDNIQTILETMGDSYLIWSDGTYKLKLDRPNTATERDELVTAYYTDVDILDSSAKVIWNGVEDRFNRATVKFENEETEFTSDSVSWPVRSSNTHIQYLSEDNNIENETTFSMVGCTHRKSALAKAEAIVRESRMSKNIVFNLGQKGFAHEIGDLINVTSVALDIENEFYVIEEISAFEDFTFQIRAREYEYTNQLWGVDDDYVQPPIKKPGKAVNNPTNLVFNEGSRVGENGNGYLTWTPPENTQVQKYRVIINQQETVEHELSQDVVEPYLDDPFNSMAGLDVFDYLYDTIITEYPNQTMTETIHPYFDIPVTVNAALDYYVTVQAQNWAGKWSSGVRINVDNFIEIEPLSGISITNSSGGVQLNWNDPAFNLVKEYVVYYNVENNRAEAIEHGRTVNQSYWATLPESASEYYFWIDTISATGSTFQMQNPVIGFSLFPPVELTSDDLYDIVDSAAIKEEAIVASKLAVTDITNKVLDQSFTDNAYWTVNNGISNVIPSSNNIAWNNENIVELTGANTATFETKPFAIDPAGVSFFYDYTASTDAANGAIIGLAVAVDDQFSLNYAEHFGDGVDLSDPTRKQGEIFIPSGSKWAKVILQKNDSANTATFGGVVIREKNAGQLIVDGSILANHIAANTITANNVSTDSFSAAGLSIFGGDLKSDNFVSNTSGWQISANGDAEFSNVISRSWFKSGTLLGSGVPIDIEILEESNPAFKFKHPGLVQIYVIGAGGSGAAEQDILDHRMIAQSGSAGGTCISMIVIGEDDLDNEYIAIVGAPAGGYANPIRGDGVDGGSSEFVGHGLNMVAEGGKGGSHARTKHDPAIVSAKPGGSAYGGDNNFVGGGVPAYTLNDNDFRMCGSGAVNFGLSGAQLDGSFYPDVGGSTSGTEGVCIDADLLNMALTPVPFVGYKNATFNGAKGNANTTSGTFGVGGPAVRQEATTVKLAGAGMIGIIYFGENDLTG